MKPKKYRRSMMPVIAPMEKEGFSLNFSHTILEYPIIRKVILDIEPKLLESPEKANPILDLIKVYLFEEQCPKPDLIKDLVSAELACTLEGLKILLETRNMEEIEDYLRDASRKRMDNLISS